MNQKRQQVEAPGPAPSLVSSFSFLFKNITYICYFLDKNRGNHGCRPSTPPDPATSLLFHRTEAFSITPTRRYLPRFASRIYFRVPEDGKQIMNSIAINSEE